MRKNGFRWSVEGRLRSNSRYVCIGEGVSALTWCSKGIKKCYLYRMDKPETLEKALKFCNDFNIAYEIEHKHICRPRSNNKIIDVVTGYGVYNYFTESRDEGYKKKDQTLLYAVLNDESKIKTMAHGDLVELMHDARCLVMTLAKEIAKRRSGK